MNFIKRYGMVSGVIAICFCVVVYVVFTTHSIFTISRQINYVAEHPYKAMSEINKIRARVLEMIHTCRFSLVKMKIILMVSEVS